MFTIKVLTDALDVATPSRVVRGHAVDVLLGKLNDQSGELIGGEGLDRAHELARLLQILGAEREERLLEVLEVAAEELAGRSLERLLVFLPETQIESARQPTEGADARLGQHQVAEAVQRG